MESFANPSAEFVHEGPIDMSNTSIHVSDNGIRCVTSFQVQSYQEWTRILGNTLADLFSIFGHGGMAVVQTKQTLITDGYLKAFTLSVSDAYMQHIAKTSRLGGHREVTSSSDTDTPSAATCVSSVYFVGSKSYIWGSDARVNGIDACSYRHLVVSMNRETNKASELPQSWREKSLAFLKSSKRSNEPMDIPDCPTLSSPLISLRITVHPNHTDSNNHTNYKFYLFGSILSLRIAMGRRLVAGCEDADVDGVVVKDMLGVFQKESHAGENVVFQLVPSDEDGIFVCACYRDDVRLFYSRLVTAGIKGLPGKL